MLAEKLWGSKEDLLKTTRLISTIKLDVRGQSWKAEQTEEKELAFSEHVLSGS